MAKFAQVAGVFESINTITRYHHLAAIAAGVDNRKRVGNDRFGHAPPHAVQWLLILKIV
jgi:hypothetical protein